MNLLRTPKYINRQILIQLAGVVALTAVLWLLIDRWWLPVCVLPLLLLGFHYRQTIPARWRVAWPSCMLM